MREKHAQKRSSHFWSSKKRRLKLRGYIFCLCVFWILLVKKRTLHLKMLNSTMLLLVLVMNCCFKARKKYGRVHTCFPENYHVIFLLIRLYASTKNGNNNNDKMVDFSYQMTLGVGVRFGKLCQSGRGSLIAWEPSFLSYPIPASPPQNEVSSCLWCDGLLLLLCVSNQQRVSIGLETAATASTRRVQAEETQFILKWSQPLPTSASSTTRIVEKSEGR